ncbi:hypothetical protein EKH49_15820 [Glutamicibacter sp. HZAU]|nr:hypothetical protein EKH49_15820 [Glutamicibacter sp. HZAU]
MAQRLAVEAPSESQYHLGLLGAVPADDRARLQVMEAGNPGIDEFAECLAGIQERVDDPDPSYTRAWTTRLLGDA